MFAKAQVRRIIKRAQAKKVSREAVLTLGQLMEDRGLELVAKAIEVAKYAGRQTLKAQDFRFLRSL